METYRNRLVTLIASIRSDDKAQIEETNGVIENLTQEMQTYSLLLIKTQIALDHKEKETMALRYEVEQINLAEKDSMSNHVKKKIEDLEILIKDLASDEINVPLLVLLINPGLTPIGSRPAYKISFISS